MSDWGPMVFWHWWILSGVLLILELTSPIFFFLWVSIAAAAVGFLLLIIPGMSLEIQLVSFGIMSVVAVMAWRKYREAHPPESEQPLLNQRGLQYNDRIFTLDHPIVNGAGKVVVDDSTWKVKGPDLPAGMRVRVTGVDGTVFIVEPAD
ncbi:MAG: NfeD family protein [Xanthomonadales bacterium]|nr:NfeD family protein [Xanthomonadales bacterium]